ncbi:hypothetical protein ATCC90586_003771 [Pythium insidiosum]|nr:hypothetical protein ATCC90586_003771 [Pythium insidiosum]
MVLPASTSTSQAPALAQAQFPRREGSARRHPPPPASVVSSAPALTTRAPAGPSTELSTGLRRHPSATAARTVVDAFDPQRRPELHYLHDEVAAVRAGRGYYHPHEPARAPGTTIMSSPNPWEGARRREEWPSHHERERASRRDATIVPPMPSLAPRRRDQYAAEEIKLFVPPRSAPRLTPTSGHNNNNNNNQIVEKGPGLTTRTAPAPAPAASPSKPYASPQLRKMRLPEGMLHLWIYQARHLVFKRLFESMYERHGLRLRVYVTSRRSGDVSEIFETRRNYGGNMANPRWRRDKDDARDNKYGHFCIPLIRATLREDTELMIEIVCGILVVAHARVSLPALLLGSFGTTPELLASQSVQFRPHWFPLAGDDSGLLEISLEFISARLIRRQQESQQQHRQQYLQQQQQHQELFRHMQPPYHHHHQQQQQPESDFGSYEEEYKRDDQVEEEEEEEREKEKHDDTKAAVTVPMSSIANDPVYQEEQRQHAYDELEQHEWRRRQRFEVTSSRAPAEGGEEKATRTRSTTASSSRSTRFQLPPTVVPLHDEAPEQQQQQQDEEEDASLMGPMRSSDDLVIMRSSSISGNEFDDDPSEYASVSTAAPEERMMNKQLWELYCYGLADDGPSGDEQDNDHDDEDPDGSGGDGDDEAPTKQRREPASPRSDGSDGRKLSMSEVSGYSMAFSDVSEASFVSRDASTCCSEILSYNDRIQRMEDAIRAARERRHDDELNNNDSPSATRRLAAAELPRSVGPPQSEPPRPKAPPLKGPASGRPTPAPISTYGWERPAPPRPAPSPASSEPIMDRPKPGVVLFDPEHIPVKGDAGQPDPALAAYRAKMLARRRSLPVKSLAATPGMGMGPSGGAWQPPRAAMMQERPYVLNANNQTEEQRTLQKLQQLDRHVAAMAAATAVSAAAAAAAMATTPMKMKMRRPPPLLLPPAVEELPPAPVSPVLSSLATDAGSCIDEDDAKAAAAAAAATAGPPPLRRKRSSSLHSVSDLLRDHVQIHNLNTSVDDSGATTMARQLAPSHMRAAACITALTTGERTMPKTACPISIAATVCTRRTSSPTALQVAAAIAAESSACACADHIVETTTVRICAHASADAAL